MALLLLDDGWRQFGDGKMWRTKGPDYLCEIDEEGNTPNYCQMRSILPKVRQVKAFYSGRLQFGMLDEFGNALDIITANSFTESYGTVPGLLKIEELRAQYDACAGDDAGAKLDQTIRYIAGQQKYLERREPGYVNPIATPGRVSVGAHHVLIATAVGLQAGASKDSAEARASRIAELVFRIPSDALFAATLAIQYFNSKNGKHFNEIPLLAATYNAGSPRLTSKNPWNLVQYGEHIDRWIAYYNTSRMC
jgi:hypothetical protein